VNLSSIGQPNSAQCLLCPDGVGVGQRGAAGADGEPLHGPAEGAPAGPVPEHGGRGDLGGPRRLRQETPQVGGPNAGPPRCVSDHSPADARMWTHTHPIPHPTHSHTVVTLLKLED